MLVRVVRSLTPEEVFRRICRFEEQYSLVFDEFEDRFLKRKKPRHLLSAYLEWAGLVDAYRGYEEEGELDYIVEEIREFDSGQLALLTPKRIELLNHLANTRVESINELAHKVKRDVKNVYEDLVALQRLELLVLKRRGKRNVVPETLVEEITFLVR
ncbi:MAG: hypothetical protein OEY24_00270 [Candidatus Bathyarchaeota archaeon]|nr:hypothetical protein [Candidatus Bathyarchaeota archaeon]